MVLDKLLSAFGQGFVIYKSNFMKTTKFQLLVVTLCILGLVGTCAFFVYRPQHANDLGQMGSIPGLLPSDE
jgi:hypothetical protein